MADDGSARAAVRSKIGAKVAYDEREVERFIAAQARKSTSDNGREAA